MITKNWTTKTALANTDYTVINEVLTVCTLSMIVFNTNPATTGTVKLRLLNSGSVEQAKIMEIEVPAKDSIMLDTKIFLNASDKLVVNSSITGIDVIISGTEG